MSFGSGSSNSTTTSQIKYTPEQKQAINAAMPTLLSYIKSPPTVPGTQTVLPFNPLQQQAQAGAVSQATGPLSGFTSGMMDISNWLNSSGGLGQNPYMQQAVAGATRPMTENLTENALPAIRQESLLGGVYGGSREYGAEDRAIRDTQRQIGDTSSQMYSQAYESGLDRIVKNLALAPQTAQLSMYPSQVLEGVGGQQYGLSTAQAQDTYNRQMLAQQMPFLASKDALSVLMALGTGTTTTGTPAQQSTLGGLLSGGIGGAATAGALGTLPGLGMLAGPWGVAGGAALGALASIF